MITIISPWQFLSSAHALGDNRYYHTALTTHYGWGCSGEGPVPTFHHNALLNNISMFIDYVVNKI